MGFDVRVTVHHDKFLYDKLIRRTKFSNLFGRKLYMFRTVPLSIIRSFSLYIQQWYMSYKFADSLRAGAFVPARKLSANLYGITVALRTVKNS